MKTENEFNAYLSKELKRWRPEVYTMKAADKFRTGVSDFILWGWGRSVALETKFIKEWPSERGKLLKHPFTGPQLTFFRNIQGTGCHAFGLIAVKEERKMFAISAGHIPESGNWKTKDFLDCSPVCVTLDWKSIESLLAYLFSHESSPFHKAYSERRYG